MGLCTELKYKNREIIKTSPTATIEDKKDNKKAINEHSYENIKSIVLQDSTEKININKPKKHIKNIKNKIEIL